MRDVEVIDDPAVAALALDPVRSRLLAELVEPGSAGSLAPRVGISRQKVNYHLRALEAHGLVELEEERKRGGITERVLRATAASYMVSPAALGEAANKRLPTLSIDTEIRFRTAEDRAAFADELTTAVLDLAARCHHDDGRAHRLVVAAHPTPAPKET